MGVFFPLATRRNPFTCAVFVLLWPALMGITVVATGFVVISLFSEVPLLPLQTELMPARLEYSLILVLLLALAGPGAQLQGLQVTLHAGEEIKFSAFVRSIIYAVLITALPITTGNLSGTFLETNGISAFSRLGYEEAGKFSQENADVLGIVIGFITILFFQALWGFTVGRGTVRGERVRTAEEVVEGLAKGRRRRLEGVE